MSKVDEKELIAFKKECIQNPAEIITQKYLIEGYSYFFSSLHDSNEEYQFKKKMASSLDVHLRDICIVGSGKLGFSIKPDVEQPGFYPFKLFDEDYEKDNNNQKSDIDVAIISNNLFDKQILNIYDHTNCYDKAIIKNQEIKNLGSYVLKGWIFTDVLPKSYQLDGSYLDVKREYESKYEREINIGIYKSWYYFEKYHQNNIKNLSLNLLSSS